MSSKSKARNGRTDRQTDRRGAILNAATSPGDGRVVTVQFCSDGHYSIFQHLFILHEIFRSPFYFPTIYANNI